MNLNSSSIPIRTSDYVESDEHFNSIVAQLADQHEPIQPTPTSASFVESLRITRITSSTLEFYSKGCAICTDSFAVDDKAMQLPCQHTYHKDCIVEWLNRSNTCPLCRHKLPEEEAPECRPKLLIVRRRRPLYFAVMVRNSAREDLMRSGFTRIQTSPPVVNPMESSSTRRIVRPRRSQS